MQLLEGSAYKSLKLGQALVGLSTECRAVDGGVGRRPCMMQR